MCASRVLVSVLVSVCRQIVRIHADGADVGVVAGGVRVRVQIVLVAQSVGLLLGAMVQDATTAWSIANVLTLGLMLVGG